MPITTKKSRSRAKKLVHESSIEWTWLEEEPLEYGEKKIEEIELRISKDTDEIEDSES